MRLFTCLLLLAAVHPLAVAADHPPTQLIPFQARLTDSSGQPVPDGVYEIAFAIYDSPTGGTPLGGWIERHETVSLVSGVVSVLLGALRRLDDPNGDGDTGDAVRFLAHDGPRYLGMTIGAAPATEMVPRHQLVPAFHAVTADDSARLGGQPHSYYAPGSQVSDIALRVDGLESDLTTAEGALASARSDIAGLQSELESLQSSADAVDDRIAAVEGGVSDNRNLANSKITQVKSFHVRRSSYATEDSFHVGCGDGTARIRDECSGWSWSTTLISQVSGGPCGHTVYSVVCSSTTTSGKPRSRQATKRGRTAGKPMNDAIDAQHQGVSG